MKAYRAHGQTHTGTSGFSNHWPGTTEDIARALEQVFADHPDAVVLNGDDDWYAPGCNRPEKFRVAFGFEPLAFFEASLPVRGVAVGADPVEPAGVVEDAQGSHDDRVVWLAGGFAEGEVLLLLTLGEP